MKAHLISALGLLFTLGVAIYCLPGFAQTTSNTNNNSNLTATIIENYNGVEVLFQSPHTLILAGERYQDHLWKALDLVKQSGYNIDAVAVTEEESSPNNLKPLYTIFLSK